MRRRVVGIAVACCALASIVFAGGSGYMASLPNVVVSLEQSFSGEKTTTPSSERNVVDIKSDVGYQKEYNGEKIYIVVGNFAAHHNGAIITADSAVRYSEKRLECFGNVLINKGTTYIYGDRAEYDGDKNEATVYSRIVKVLDEGSTLYTYHFKFNTETNIGEFYGGGVVSNEDNLLEADRGFYYADTKEIVCVERVQMRNETYEMTGDSVIYNMDTHRARFYTSTNIWNNKENEFLSADCGSFDRDSQRYTITRNGYVLTREQEMWSDSIDYYRERGYARLRNDIQIDDNANKLLAFGDWGEYWKEPGNVFLTKDPALISYDLSQGDSVFIRSDSMYVYTRDPVRERLERERAEAEAKAAAEAKAKAEAEEAARAAKKQKTKEKGHDRAAAAQEGAAKANEAAHQAVKELRGGRGNEAGDDKADTSIEGNEAKQPADTFQSSLVDTLHSDTVAVDSLQKDSLPKDTLTKAQRKALLREQVAKVKAEIKRAKADSLRKKLDAIAERRQAKKTAMLRRMEVADSIRNAKAKARADARLRKRMDRLTRRGVKIKPIDAKIMATIDSMMAGELHLGDSLANRVLDSLAEAFLSRLQQDTVSVAKDTMAVDSSYKMILGYRNVRMFRSDFQAVCDSIIGTTIDSIIHLHINPILWNDQNQIVSDVMHVITKNQEVVRVDFEGKPLTIAEIDTVHYNQVAGKQMSAHFRDSQIYRNDVNGNVQTIYYMQEEGSDEISMMTYIESGDMSTYIEDRQITGITYRGNPTYTFYPMDKIPESRSIYLDGFRWEKHRRPTQDSVFVRTIRPSMREEIETMPHPTFPIREDMERRKVRLINRKLWSDRTDTLTVETREWIESLAFGL